MPLDTVMLLDTSDSMAGNGIRELKRACGVFLDGVQETARETNLQENIAVVEFCNSARVLQSLTNNYDLCRQTVDSLTANGDTKMFGDGLLTSLEEILQNGGLLELCGITMTPRVILVTEGKLIDTAGEEEAKKKLLEAAKDGIQQVGLPYTVPIACVGCGDCDEELLQAITKLTNGMYVVVGNISELSTFFRRQVLLTRFAATFASDMGKLQSRQAFGTFLNELDESIEAAELEGMMQLLHTMLCLSTQEEDTSAQQAAQITSDRSLPCGSTIAAVCQPQPPEQFSASGPTAEETLRQQPTDRVQQTIVPDCFDVGECCDDAGYCFLLQCCRQIECLDFRNDNDGCCFADYSCCDGCNCDILDCGDCNCDVFDCDVFDCDDCNCDVDCG